MSRNSLYPGFIRIEYQANGHTHSQTLPVIPTLVGSIWTLAKCQGGSYADWTAAVDAWVSLITQFFHTSDSIIKADLYTLASPTATPVFVATYSIGAAGVSSSPNDPNAQAVWTWRAAGGYESRMMLMEGVTTGEGHIAYPTGQAAVDPIFVFYTSSDGFVFSRGGGAPIAPLFFTTKINDKLRKTYVLNA